MSLSHVLESRSFHRALQALILVLAVVFLVQTYGRAERPGGYDFTSYLQSAKALASGTDPYHTETRFPYIYPLFLAFVLVPLTHVPYAIAVVTWFALGAASLHLSAGLAARLADANGRPKLLVAVSWLTLLGALDPVQVNLLNGQVNSEILLLCLLFFDQHEKRRWRTASLCLAIAIALKIVPLVLLAFLAGRRGGRTLVASLVGAAALCLSPALLVGRRIFDFYTSYGHEFLLARARPTSGDGTIFFTPYGFIGWLIPSLGGSSLVRFGAIAFVLGAMAFYQLRRPERTDYRLFCLWLVAIPFLSPLSEVHHLILVLPAALLLSAEALDSNARPRASVVVSTALFWCGLWIGRLDRQGPYYFLALTALLIGLWRGGELQRGSSREQPLD
jgi:hypothetical protein